MTTYTIEPQAPSELETGQSSLPIPSPQDLRAQIPCSARTKKLVSSSRAEIQNILRGLDEHRLLVVCGPCSIHDTSAAFDYAQRLAKLASEVREDILLLMRTYFEKPRSIVGWKGLLYDSELEGSSATVGGLGVARRILASIAAPNFSIRCWRLIRKTFFPMVPSGRERSRAKSIENLLRVWICQLE